MNFEDLVPVEKIEIKQTKIDFEKNNTESPWLWNNKIFENLDNKHFSFVYRITNKLNGKFYIGYKGFYSKRTKTVKGKKKHLLVESDWKKYWSSGENLHKDISKLGIGNFKREILALCPMKGVGKFTELFLQLYFGVLTHNKDKTYNGIVNVRLSSKTVSKFTEVIFCDELKDIKL